MELARVEPEVATLLDTLPALLFAAEAVCGGLLEKQLKVLQEAGLGDLMDNGQGRLKQMPLKRDDKSVDTVRVVKVFTKELSLILDSNESLEETAKQIEKVREEWLPFMHILLYGGISRIFHDKSDYDYDNDDDGDNGNDNSNSNTNGNGNFNDNNNYYKALHGDLRTALLQRLLPASARLWLTANAKFPSLFEPKMTNHSWLEGIWMLICKFIIPKHSHKESPAELVTKNLSAAVSILARMLRIYMPWAESGQVATTLFEHFNFDIRGHPIFITLIKVGLECNDNSICKQTLFILKQTIKFGTFYLQPSLGLEKGQSSSLEKVTDSPFLWPVTKRELQGKVWREFLLLFESVQETQAHIVEPMLPLLKSLMSEAKPGMVQLDPEWWEIIVQKAMVSDSTVVRRHILSTILEMDLKQYPRLKVRRSFLFGPFLTALDSTTLYHVSLDAPTMVSPFGMNVARFYSSFVEASSENYDEAITFFLRQVQNRVRSATPTLFLLQSLLLLPSSFKPLLNGSGVELLKSFSRNTGLLHNIKARRLARWQLLHIFLRLAEPNVLSFEEVAAALTEFLRERSEQFTVDCRDYNDINVWLTTSYQGDYVDRNIALTVQQYFLKFPNLPTKDMQVRAEEIAIMLSFTLEREGGFAQSIRPLYQQMALIGAAETRPNFIIAAIVLFVILNDTIKAVSKGKADLMSCLEVSARLYEWISVLESLLLYRIEELFDLPALVVLLQAQKLFFSKAAEKPGPLIAYLDILLYQLTDLLGEFVRKASAEVAESYSTQLLKIVGVELMTTALVELEAANTFHVGFLKTATLEYLYSIELEKPAELSDSQADSWSSLLVTFASSRWALIAALTRFSKKSVDLQGIIDVPTVFKRCLLELEVAKFKPVLAIFDCMRILVSLDGEGRMIKSDYSSSTSNKGEDSPSKTGKGDNYNDRIGNINPAVSLLPDTNSSATNLTITTNEVPEDLIRESFMISKRLIEEVSSQPVWYYLYLEGFMDYFFQPAVLIRPENLDAVNSPIANVLTFLLKTAGIQRKSVAARLSRNLGPFWSTPLGRRSRQALQPFFIEMLVFGPIREDSEDRLAHALALSNYQDESMVKDDGIIKELGVGNDYLVRVHMNNILLHLDPNNYQDHNFALTIIDDLLNSVIPFQL